MVPILEKLRYTDDDMVADYYAEILATASRPEGKKLVSVSFIEILNRLCADELKILEFINSSANALLLEDQEGGKYKAEFKGVLPVVNVHVVQRGGGYIVAVKNLTYLPQMIEMDSSTNFNMYLDNMSALGLVLKPAMISAHDKNIYKYIKKHPIISKVESQLGEGQSIDYSEARFELTELGRQLLSIASKNDKS